MKTRLDEIIKIDNRFEKSVNLGLDLDNPQKLVNYIPTKSSVKLLVDYLKSTLEMTSSRANILVGPYGKGKSHLLLVLLSYLAKYNTEELNILTEKIIGIDPENADIFKNVSKLGKFLPVLINPGESTLNKAFYKGLMASLKKEGITDIVPDNYYSEAISIIEKWKNEFPDTYKLFQNNISVSADSFVKELEKYNEKTLEEFRLIYPNLTSGSPFNPIVDDEIISVYKSVNRKLKSVKGYAGIYIVFDEFSKFVEAHNEDKFADDMKTLQDICELCLASKEEQIHITCVAHKSIQSYSKLLSSEVLNLFEGVSARLEQKNFIVSSKNNYELIADALIKDSKLFTTILSDENICNVMQKSYELRVFSSLFTKDDFASIVAKGCFPLTPLSAMILLELSEKIAQNERTIFTYLTGKDRYSLSQVIHEQTNLGFVGIDSIYDYFYDVFKTDLSDIHFEWLKSEYAISKVDSDEEIQLLKSIALINMISKEELPPTEEVLAMAIGKSIGELNKLLSSLINKNIIEYKNRTKSYDYKNNLGIDIESEIEAVIQKNFSKVDIAETLSDINYKQAILPKRHNQNFSITRYFNIVFLSGTQLLSLEDIRYLNFSNKPDGIVVFVIDDGTSIRAISEHLKNEKLKSLIVVLQKNRVNINKKIKSILAIRKLRESKQMIDDYPAIQTELINLEEDIINEINEWIDENYFNSSSCYIFGKKINIEKLGINRIVSNVCDELYPLTPVINNELINRHYISKQISKASSNIINQILVDEDKKEYENESSAEATIYRSIFSYRDKSREQWTKIENIFDSFFNKSIDNKVSFIDLIEILEKPPFGLRQGVIPIIVAHEIMKRHGTTIIYLKDNEISLNDESIINAVHKPQDYSIYIEKASAEKDKYISNILELFSEYSQYCQDYGAKNKMSKAVCLMQTWYRSLPQASATFMVPDKPGQDIEVVNSFRNIFKEYYLNPREILFETIPNIFKTNNFDDVYKYVRCIKNDVTGHLSYIKNDINEVIRQTFKFNDKESLSEALRHWYINLPDITKNSIFSGNTESVMQILKTEIPTDFEMIAALFAKAVTGMYVEDWTTETFNYFKNQLHDIYETIMNRSETSSSTKKISFVSDEGDTKDLYIDYNSEQLSTAGSFFKNAINEAIDEYGDTIDSNEKIGILMDLMSKLL